MNRIIDRIAGLGINQESAVFTITSKDLLMAISEEVDLETVTDHELREIVVIVTMALNHMDWLSVVRNAVTHLPFGLNQTGIAINGHYPCTGCPDAMIEDGHCYHDQECKAFEVYQAHF